MGMVKEILACIIVTLLLVLTETNVEINVAFFPLVMAGMGLAQGIMGGMAQSAAADRRNAEATNKWAKESAQTAWNNAKSQLDTLKQFENQLKRNNQINQKAFEYRYDATQALQAMNNTKKRETSNLAMSQRATLMSSAGARGLSARSGSTLSMITAQANALMQANKNQELEYAQGLKNIRTQEKNILNEKTFNTFMPNIQGFNPPPIPEDTKAPLIGGIVSGVMGGVSGAMTGQSFVNMFGGD
jgi:hypothetical protein